MPRRTRPRIRALPLITAVIALSVSATARVAIVSARTRAARSSTPAPAVTTLGEGSWCWFADPRASSWAASRTWGGSAGRERSRSPSTGPRQAVPVGFAGKLGFTYPNPLLLSAEGNLLYLFWRGADWSADYATRTPAGTWSKARRLLIVNGERPYLKADVRDGSQIGLAFTNGHPRNVLTSIDYAEIHHGSLWHANGRWIARLSSGPISPSQADVVHNAQKMKVSAWVWDVAFTTTGHPVIVYATFPKPSEHLYWYARWTGSRWVNHMLTHGGGSISPSGTEYEYSGGVALDHQDPSNLYLSRQVPGGWQIERWSTRDGGAHWTRQLVVPVAGADKYGRSSPAVRRPNSSGSTATTTRTGRTAPPCRASHSTPRRSPRPRDLGRRAASPPSRTIGLAHQCTGSLSRVCR